MKEQIVFDDWIYRSETTVKQRKKDYFICFVPLWTLAIISILGMFFSLYAIIPLVLAIFINIEIYEG